MRQFLTLPCPHPSDRLSRDIPGKPRHDCLTGLIDLIEDLGVWGGAMAIHDVVRVFIPASQEGPLRVPLPHEPPEPVGVIGEGGTSALGARGKECGLAQREQVRPAARVEDRTGGPALPVDSQDQVGAQEVGIAQRLGSA